MCVSLASEVAAGVQIPLVDDGSGIPYFKVPLSYVLGSVGKVPFVDDAGSVVPSVSKTCGKCGKIPSVPGIGDKLPSIGKFPSIDKIPFFKDFGGLGSITKNFPAGNYVDKIAKTGTSGV